MFGPQPVVSGRELGPPPPNCGPGLVAMLLGPLVQRPLLHRPLAHSAALAQALPSLLPVPLPECEPGEPPPFSELPPQAEGPKRLNESAIAASAD